MSPRIKNVIMTIKSCLKMWFQLTKIHHIKVSALIFETLHVAKNKKLPLRQTVCVS